MKDIYELLNDVDIDVHEFEEMKVNEVEKARVKKALKKSIQVKKKVRRRYKNIAAAALVLGLSTMTVGFAFPTSASNIPIIGDIFKFIGSEKSGFYDHYKEYSTHLDMMEESNGIKITINDAIFDGETVSVTFTVESEQDLGKDPIIFNHLDIKGANRMSGSSKITKVENNKYVGLMTASEFTEADLENVKVNWEIGSITIPENDKEIKGDWDFAFSINATESKSSLIGQSVKEKGIQVNIEKISVTPVSFVVYYDQVVSEEIRNKWQGTYVDLEVKDDLGNVYSGEGNGGSGKEGYYMSWSKTFEKLNPNATKLIITPHVTNYSSENQTSMEMTKDGPKEVKLPEKPGKGQEEFVLEDIVIDLKK